MQKVGPWFRIRSRHLPGVTAKNAVKPPSVGCWVDRTPPESKVTTQYCAVIE